MLACTCDDRGPKAEPAAAATLSRGDRVLVEERAAEFFEGRVLEVQGDELFVQPARDGQAVTVSKSDTYRLPAGATGISPGDFAVCNVRAARWQACQVVKSTERGLVVNAGENQQVLPPSRVLAPSAVTRLNVQRYFARQEARAGFVEAVRAAGAPVRPAHWRPSARERVVARKDDGWYSGSIHEIEDDGLRIEWADRDDVTKVPRGHVVPEPPYAATLSAGRYALMRPAAPARPWRAVRVEQVAGDALTVVDADGEKRSATAAELIPLGK